jgi:hypothetical protein
MAALAIGGPRRRPGAVFELQDMTEEGRQSRTRRDVPSGDDDTGSFEPLDQGPAIGILDRGKVETRRCPVDWIQPELSGCVSFDHLAQGVNDCFKPAVAGGEAIGVHGEAPAARRIGQSETGMDGFVGDPDALVAEEIRNLLSRACPDPRDIGSGNPWQPVDIGHPYVACEVRRRMQIASAVVSALRDRFRSPPSRPMLAESRSMPPS